MIILFSKSMGLYVGSRFLVSHHGLCKLRHFYGLSPLETMSEHNWQAFHSREVLSLLVNTRLIFSLPFYSIMRLYWVLSHLTEPTQSNTKRSVDLLTMHSHPFNEISLCICNERYHCMLYHVTCTMKATWTILPMQVTNASWTIISICI